MLEDGETKDAQACANERSNCTRPRGSGESSNACAFCSFASVEPLEETFLRDRFVPWD